MPDGQWSPLELMPLQEEYRRGKRTAPRDWKRNTALHELHGCMAVWNYALDRVADGIERIVEREGDSDVPLSQIAELLRGEAFVLPGEQKEAA